jgi:NAD(P)-dependent dehydrogenase (short-subunit alcohol dehydrogenase family)
MADVAMGGLKPVLDVVDCITKGGFTMAVMDLFNLSGNVVLVTCAGSGLGQGFAKAVAEAGADVACADFNPTTAKQTAERICALGRRAVAIEVDVAQEASVRQMVAETVGQLGALDVIFRNAGIGGGCSGQAHEIAMDTWHRVIAINLTGVFLCVREDAKVMLPRHRGKMILSASIYGQVGSFNGLSPAYTAAKGGVANLTKELAIEYAPHGITVNAIAPGFFHTNIMVASGYSEQESTERYERLKRHIPLGRVGKPEDLQGTAVYLASAASDYMTGHILTVDGGWLDS